MKPRWIIARPNGRVIDGCPQLTVKSLCVHTRSFNHRYAYFYPFIRSFDVPMGNPSGISHIRVVDDPGGDETIRILCMYRVKHPLDTSADGDG